LGQVSSRHRAAFYAGGLVGLLQEASGADVRAPIHNLPRLRYFGANDLATEVEPARSVSVSHWISSRAERARRGTLPMDRNYKGAAGRVTDSMKDKLGEIAADAARTAVESNLDQAAASVESRYGAVLDPMAEATDRLSRLARAKPLTTLLIAAAAGFVIGRR